MLINSAKKKAKELIDQTMIVRSFTCKFYFLFRNLYDSQIFYLQALVIQEKVQLFFDLVLRVKNGRR